MATKSKGGYDFEFVETPQQNLECSICLMILRDPHVTSCCGNHFCHRCISQVSADRRPCPLCNATDFTTLLHKGVQREVNALVIYCKWKRLGCEWQGKLAEIGEHLDPKEEGPCKSGCGYVLVECSNKCGAMVERRQLVQHEMDDCPKRLVEVQMSSLTWKLENRLKVVETKLEDVLKEKDAMKDRLLDIKEQNKTLIKENQVLKRELEVVKRITLHTADTPPYYYTVHNFNHYKKADMVLFSPPFYSHLGGYKLRLQLYPNGTKHAKNSAISLFVGIMVGEYDSDLSWPFKGTITTEIFNCVKNAWDNTSETHLVPKYYSDRCVKRPVDCVANDASGTVPWLSHDELYKNYMISGYDFVRFRVKEVQLHA